MFRRFKTLPDFPLETWELPECAANTLAFAPATCQFLVALDGAPRNWVFRVESSAANSNEPCILCHLASDLGGGAWKVLGAPSEMQLLAHDLKSGNRVPAANALERGNFHRERFLYFDEHLELLRAGQNAALRWGSRDGKTAWWANVRAAHQPLARFAFSTPLDFLTMPASSLVKRLRHELSDSQGDCSFALRMAREGWDNVVEPLFVCQNQSRPQWEQVLIWLAYDLTANLSFQTAQWSVCIDNSTAVLGVEHETTALDYELELDDQYHNPDECQMRWHVLINRYFDPRYREDLVTKYTVFQHQLRYGHLFHSFTFGPPSFHERLEARLNLEKWLEGKVPTREKFLYLGDPSSA